MSKFLFYYAEKNHEFLLFMIQFIKGLKIVYTELILTNFESEKWLCKIYFSMMDLLSEIWIWLSMGQSLEHISFIMNKPFDSRLNLKSISLVIG